MKHLELFKTFRIKPDREEGVIPVLAWLEYDGNDGIIHITVWPEKIGTASSKLTWPLDHAEELFHALTEKWIEEHYDDHLAAVIEFWDE